MLAHVQTAALCGVDSIVVQVEVNLAPGLPSFTVVGLPHGAVREGRERVSAALRNSGFPLPQSRITVNLAPAGIRKVGTAFDLPIAVGLLAAGGALEAARLAGQAFVGELGLDGTVRGVRGVLPIAVGCQAAGVHTLFVPTANAAEAGIVEGLRVFAADTIGSVARHLKGDVSLPRISTDAQAALAVDPAGLPDLRDVRGQEAAKRVLEIAAAGSHNMLLLGPPGSGKTMLARRLAGILPPMTLQEALETSRVHSVAGLLRPGAGLLGVRPFRSPHHTVSDAGLVGGGSPPSPGEVSLAHNGVLFLDELAEFRRSVLDVLREPLEEGVVHISRARGSVHFPARILLVAAMNPCPCGYWGDGTDRCLCDPGIVARYLGRISGPLVDRIDLHLHVPAVAFQELSGSSAGSGSAEARARVQQARAIQQARFSSIEAVHANGQMGPSELRSWCRPTPGVARLLQRAMDRVGISARGYHRILKVARTIADLGGGGNVAEAHVAEALQYRYLDRMRP